MESLPFEFQHRMRGPVGDVYDECGGPVLVLNGVRYPDRCFLRRLRIPSSFMSFIRASRPALNGAADIKRSASSTAAGSSVSAITRRYCASSASMDWSANGSIRYAGFN